MGYFRAILDYFWGLVKALRSLKRPLRARGRDRRGRVIFTESLLRTLPSRPVRRIVIWPESGSKETFLTEGLQEWIFVGFPNVLGDFEGPPPWPLDPLALPWNPLAWKQTEKGAGIPLKGLQGA